MRRFFKTAFALGLMGLAICAPLVGNAYYCSKEVISHANESLIMAQEESLEKQALGLTARSYILYEPTSQEVLLSHNEAEKFSIASMTKMMTLLIVMEELNAGNLSLNQEVLISEYAASQEGSECFLDPLKSYQLDELIKSVVVASANDSTVALAELVAGSEEMFAKKMNEKAKALGLSNTHFVNATGLDTSGHYGSAEDMAKIITQLSKYELLSQMSKTWVYDMQHSGGRVTNLTNTNRLIRSNPDCYFAKTGHTDDAGYCITVYAKRGGMDLVACVMGVKDSKIRFEEVTRLLNYGFSNFELEKIIDTDSPLGKIEITNSNTKEVEFFAKDSYSHLSKKGEDLGVSTEINLISPKLSAPLKQGDKVGELTIKVGDHKEIIDLVIKADINERSLKEIIEQLITY